MGGKVVLVCGASGGLGHVVAETLQARGMTVFGTMRAPGNAPQNFTFPVIAMDVTDEASVARCFDDVIDQTGRVDVVVNCVNQMILGSVEETAVEEVAALYDTNVLGAARIARAALPHMRAQGNGAIINMSSLGGVLAVPFLSAYTSAKFALEAFSEALYHEVKGDNIDVVIMQPVAMRMDRPETGDHLRAARNISPDSFTHKMLAQMAKDTAASKLTPEMVAQKIAEVVESKDRKLRYPMDRAKMLGMVKRLAPQWVVDRLIGGLVSSAARAAV
jgi:short-subunit dehydrogenase